MLRSIRLHSQFYLMRTNFIFIISKELSFRKKLVAVTKLCQCHFHACLATSMTDDGSDITLTKGLRTVPHRITVRLASTTDNPNCDTNTSISNQSTPPNVVKLHSWAFSVEQFGNLSVRTSSSVKVTPTDPYEYPAADRAFIHLLEAKNEDEDDSRRTQHLRDAILAEEREDVVDNRCHHLARCDVQYKDGIISISDREGCHGNESEMLSQEDGEMLWLIEVPMSYDVNIEARNHGSIRVEQLENQICNLQTEQAGIYTNKLKSDNVTLKSASGDIKCSKVLQGNVTIATGNHGTVISDRLQGQDVAVYTVSGAILVKDVYAKTSFFTSMRGNIHLGNLHGDVNVSCQQGDLNVGSLDGSLEAEVNDGNTSAYIAQHVNVDISCKQGDISIKTPPDVQTKLHLIASQDITIPQELSDKMSSEISENKDSTIGMQTISGSLNGGKESSLRLSARQGSITLAVQSWLDSLNLLKE